jgi:hypothetical protein
MDVQTQISLHQHLLEKSGQLQVEQAMEASFRLPEEQE